MAHAHGKRRPTVIFVDDWGWASFDQVAAALRRRRWRTVRLMTERPGAGRLPALRIADRLFYDDCWALDEAANRARVIELLHSGGVVDVISAEDVLAELGLETPIGRALTGRSLAFAGTPAQQALDKFWVNEALAGAGLDTPRQARASELSPADAARRFGLPLVIKHPIGAAGHQVRIAGSVPEILVGLDELGGPEAPLFYQEHVPGRVVLYCAVAGPHGPLVQHAFAVKRRVYERGPTATAILHDRAAALAAGARAVEVLRPQGLLQLCFIETAEGRLFHIDANLRPWGMLAAPLELGIDFLGAYVALAEGAEGPEPAARPPQRPRPAHELRVQPNEIFCNARSAALGQWLVSAGLLLRDYARPVGLVYCGYVLSRAVLLLGRALQRKLAARLRGAVRTFGGAPAVARPQESLAAPDAGAVVVHPFGADRRPDPGGSAGSAAAAELDPSEVAGIRRYAAAQDAVPRPD
jgi:hypothetical protein